MDEYSNKEDYQRSRYFNTVSENSGPAQHDNDRPESGITSRGDNVAETVLSIVAYVVLVVGIIISIGVGYTIGSGYFGKPLLGFVYFVVGTILSFILWAGLMVTVNISINIRQIKHELRNRK